MATLLLRLLLLLEAAQPVDAIWQDVDPELAESQGTSVTSLGSLPSYDLCFQGF